LIINRYHINQLNTQITSESGKAFGLSFILVSMLYNYTDSKISLT
jgi:hypothetical protein